MEYDRQRKEKEKDKHITENITHQTPQQAYAPQNVKESYSPVTPMGTKKEEPILHQVGKGETLSSLILRYFPYLEEGSPEYKKKYTQIVVGNSMDDKVMQADFLPAGLKLRIPVSEEERKKINATKKKSKQADKETQGTDFYNLWSLIQSQPEEMTDDHVEATLEYQSYMNASLVWQWELGLTKEEAILACRWMVNDMTAMEKEIIWEREARYYALLAKRSFQLGKMKNVADMPVTQQVSYAAEFTHNEAHDDNYYTLTKFIITEVYAKGGKRHLQQTVYSFGFNDSPVILDNATRLRQNYKEGKTGFLYNIVLPGAKGHTHIQPLGKSITGLEGTTKPAKDRKLTSAELDIMMQFLPKHQKKSTTEKYFKYIFKEMTREKLTQDDINENHTKHMK
ncbi:MAG: hypothetical protein AAF734_06145, partial [Bacteroidota bacterium]